MNFSFPKSERLTQVKLIDSLFQKDSTSVSQRFVYPFRVLYLANTAAKLAAPQIVISVPKRKFKKAVHRNLLKRRIREAYRLNKPHFVGPAFQPLPDYIGFVYIGSTIEPYAKIEKRMIGILKDLTTPTLCE
ncbi:ribonuclease P protein component [Aquirufa sp. 5-AUSEE-100C1]|jgi:ribonuclease P protein component